MKKIYVLIVVCLSLAAAGSAQTRYVWVGTAGGSWSTAANWTISGAPAATFPNLATDSAVFEGGGTPTATFSGNVTVAALIVTNNTSAKITGIGGGTPTINVSSTNATNPGVRIDGGSKLECDAQSSTEFVVNFAAGSKGTVAGEWLFTGNNNTDAYPHFDFADINVRLTFISGSKMTIGPLGILVLDPGIPDAALVFAANSTFDNKSYFGTIPPANYDPASTIIISGLVDQSVFIEELNAIGNLTYNCPGQTRDLSLALATNFNFNIKGDLNISNTNTHALRLMGPSNLPNGSTNNVGIGGNLVMAASTYVLIDSSSLADVIMTVTVQGNVLANGRSFNLQARNGVSRPTNLVIKGDLIHTAGTITATSNSVNQGAGLFNIEFNGSTNQNLTSTGVIDNPNHQITLRMNNALGLTLQTPLQVGRIDFSGPNAGIITTSPANPLTLTNTSNNAFVTNAVSPTGYVNGPLGRMTTTTTPLVYKSYQGATLRQLTLTPATAGTNTFQVGFVSGSNGGAIQSPLGGIANYYWNATRPTGTSGATISMELSGAIPGASAADGLIGVYYDGSIWADARNGTGNIITPGTATSGTLTTGVWNALTAFSIGYALNSSLPINLLSFTGKKVQSSAELTWLITDNSTPAKFEVMESTDGNSFSAIGSTAGIKNKLKYSFTDASLASGNNYYRLKMYDIDGTVTMSNIIVVMNGSKGVLISSMSPTVVHDRSRLNISSSVRGNMQLVVTDISGRIVQQQLVSIIGGNQEVWLTASSLPAGMFQVTGYINGERTATFRFIKQ